LEKTVLFNDYTSLYRKVEKILEEKRVGEGQIPRRGGGMSKNPLSPQKIPMAILTKSLFCDIVREK